jgi:Tol biopolymer transport system component
VVNPAPGGGTSNALSVTIAPQAPPGTGVVQLISAAMNGGPTEGFTGSSVPPSVSGTGRYVGFQSTGTDLVPGPASGFADIYVRDTCIGAPAGCVPTTIRVSVDSNGNLANGNSRSPAISGDGRYVAFDSSATNLVPGDTQINGMADVFLRDTCTGAPAGCAPSTIRLSATPSGGQADGDSRDASISADGRFVACNSTATDLASGDTNGQIDVFVRDTCIGGPAGCTPTTNLISLASDGTQGNGASFLASISADGRLVAFQSAATNFVPGDAQNQTQVFLRDTCVGAPAGCMPSTIQVSVGTGGSLANASSGAAAISGTGRFVTFGSAATNLTSGNTHGFGQSYVHDTCVGAPAGCTLSTSMASVAFDGTPPNEGGGDASISADGRFIAFDSLASNNSVLGNPAPESVFVRDTCAGAAAGCVPVNFVVSVLQGTLQENGISTLPSLSADGHYVAFLSTATNIIPGGSNGNVQVFLAKTGF